MGFVPEKYASLGDYRDEAEDDIHLSELRVQGTKMAGQMPRLWYVELPC
jgi:hypothetical protein